jgi:hypothetical protein
MEQAFIDTCAVVTYRPIYDRLHDGLSTLLAEGAEFLFGGVGALVLGMGSSFDPNVVRGSGRLDVDQLVTVRGAIAHHKDALASAITARTDLGLPIPDNLDHWTSNWELHGGAANADGSTLVGAFTPPQSELRGAWTLRCPWDTSFGRRFGSI